MVDLFSSPFLFAMCLQAEVYEAFECALETETLKFSTIITTLTIVLIMPGRVIFADSDDEPEPEDVEESSNGEEDEDPDPVARPKRSGKASNKKAQLGTSLCLISFVAVTIFFRQGKH
jgi:hypothetical protein